MGGWTHGGWNRAARGRALCGLALLIAASPALGQQSWNGLPQGWSNAQRQWWYDVSQGSRLMPLVFLTALEQAGSTARFLEPEHIARFGYIPRRAANGAPDLPIGFAVDRQSDAGFRTTRARWRLGQGDREPWVGLNCAACHTAELRVGERRLRIEGGPTSANFQAFFTSLNEALRQTRSDSAKFGRFAAAVLKSADSADNRKRLEQALDGIIRWQDTIEIQNATPLAYGPARLDAVGHILNKVAIAAESRPLTPFPADAPVSYPFVWNAPQHDKVQWNGIAANDGKPITLFGQETDFGALGRNTGEVIGVFAELTISSFPWFGYTSSVQARNLIEIERMLKRLRSPVWDEAILGRLDQAKVARGKALFNDTGCASCHAPLAPNDLTTPIKAKMELLRSIGTDIWMACNAWDYAANTGLLEGTRTKIVKGDKMAATDKGANMLTAAVTGALIGKADGLLGSLAEDVFRPPQPGIGFEAPPSARLTRANGFPDDPVKLARAQRCLGVESDLLAYKARPLNGIWATAPYLHNGSVPTLYDLLTPSRMAPLSSLSPARQAADGQFRPEQFFLGSGVFDPVRVGMVTAAETPGNTFKFATRSADGLEILGNSNAGHNYGTLLREDQRMDLIEYLKTL